MQAYQIYASALLNSMRNLSALLTLPYSISTSDLQTKGKCIPKNPTEENFEV